MVINVRSEQVVFANSKGIQIQTQADEETADEIIVSYVEWLYNEFESYKNGEFAD